MQFEFDGQKYNKASRHQKEWGGKIIDELKLRGDEQVLDLGCGDGVLTARLAERVPAGRVTGVDSSKSMLEQAGKLARENLTFLLMDINKLGFSGEFDLVFSNATLQWVKDHRLLLGNVLKSLKASGVARFNFAGDGNCANFFAVVREVLALEDYKDLFRDFEWPWCMPSVEEYTSLADQAGFSQARVWGENADRHFESTEELVRWLDQPSLVPFLKHLKGSTAARSFRDSVVGRMIARTRQADGRCFETFRRINFLAVK